MTSLFHVRMGRSESIRDFMKCFGVAILQLDISSMDIVMQVVKPAIHPNTEFFNSLSLHLPDNSRRAILEGEPIFHVRG